MSARTRFLPFAQASIGAEEIREVEETLQSGWITTGPKVKRFEAAFAAYVGAKHAIAVSSCTAAMHLALEAIGLRRGDLVLTTPFTFAATAEVVRYHGAVPVFVDIDENTFNIDAARLEECIGRRRISSPEGRFRAVIPVHIGGQTCSVDAIHDVARRHGLVVVEDAAHALPAKDKGRMVGSLSEFTCFSFYATKTLTTGEGGMVCTENDEWADRCRIMSLHGISKDAWKRYDAGGSWYYEIVAPGYKYNMTDIAASLGIHQLYKCESMWSRRVEIARQYNEAFAAVPEVRIPHVRRDVQHAWHLYILRLRLERLKCDRAQFIEELRSANIGTSVHFIPLHLHPYYRQEYGYRPDDFPVALNMYKQVVSLPIYPRMSDRDVTDVIAAIRGVVARQRR